MDEQDAEVAMLQALLAQIVRFPNLSFTSTNPQHRVASYRLHIKRTITEMAIQLGRSIKYITLVSRSFSSSTEMLGYSCVSTRIKWYVYTIDARHDQG